MSDKAEAVCRNCGSKNFQVPENAGPEDQIKCTGCGRSAKLKDVRESLVEQTKKTIFDEVTKFLRQPGSPFKLRRK